ncbi:MAG TPA: hypothetical protein VK654_01365 [Nitrospirota bacterium]|nr:hypothetical protein [Nitrospirota bacterium]
MLEIILGIGVFVFIIYAGFQIAYLLELRKAGKALRALIETIDRRLQPSLDELESAMKNLRQTTENASAISRNLRDATDIAAILAGVWAAIKAGISALTRKEEVKQDELKQ